MHVDLFLANLHVSVPKKWTWRCEILGVQGGSPANSLLRIGVWDPFQMAELHGLYMGVILTTYKSWDDPPSICPWDLKLTMGLSSPPSSSAQKHSLYWYLSLMKKPRKKNTKNCAGFECSSYSNECVCGLLLDIFDTKSSTEHTEHILVYCIQPAQKHTNWNHRNFFLRLTRIVGESVTAWKVESSLSISSPVVQGNGQLWESHFWRYMKMEKTTWINLDQPSLKLT